LAEASEKKLKENRNTTTTAKPTIARAFPDLATLIIMPPLRNVSVHVGEYVTIGGDL
jgi:hypothetical protein